MKSSIQFIKSATKSKTLTSPIRFPPSLLNRVSTANDPRSSIVPILDTWIHEGNPVTKEQLQSLISTMRKFNRPQHALQITQWMTDQRYFDLNASDVAVRLKLIYNVHGLEHTEKYFNNLSINFKVVETYGALLDCYAREKLVDKAEAILQEMNTMGFVISSFPYNSLISLYAQTGQQEKIDTLLLEMEKKGIPQDTYTINILMSYAAASDITGMEQILNSTDNPNILVDWSSYAIAAEGYLKVGLTDKAFEMLKKIEDLTPKNRKNKVSDSLLTLYAKIGKKDDVYRIWSSYKFAKREKRSLFSHSASHARMISSLDKLGDIEGAEKIFKDWVSLYGDYHYRVLNQLMSVYCKKQLLEKAEAIIQKALESGTSIYASTWNILTMGYISDKQMSKGVEAFKKALLAGGERWKPSPATVATYLEYFEVGKDVNGAEDFVELLGISGFLTREMYHKLLRIYITANKPVSRVLDLMKANGFSVDDEAHKILLELSETEEHPLMIDRLGLCGRKFVNGAFSDYE
ncbi:hypothetical protein ACHQM5_003140 [Ranunculus cassubicifolius]